jgi:hypothetical protein
MPAELETGFHQPYLFEGPPVTRQPLTEKTTSQLEAVFTNYESNSQWVKTPSPRIRIIFESTLQQRDFNPRRPVRQEIKSASDTEDVSGFRIVGDFKRTVIDVAGRPVKGFLGRQETDEQLFLGFPFGRRTIPANAPHYNLNGAGEALAERQDPVDLTQDSDSVHAGAVDRMARNWDIIAPLIVNRAEMKGTGLRALKELNFNDFALVPRDAENPDEVDVPRCGIADLAGEFPTTDWGVFEYG